MVQSRLEFARKLVPRVRTVLVSGPAEETAKAVRAAAKSPIRVALECTGREVSIDTAINVSRSLGVHLLTTVGCASLHRHGCRDGRFHVYGTSSSSDPQLINQYPIGLCSQREIDLRYLFRYTHQVGYLTLMGMTITDHPSTRKRSNSLPTASLTSSHL